MNIYLSALEAYDEYAESIHWSDEYTLADFEKWLADKADATERIL